MPTQNRVNIGDLVYNFYLDNITPLPMPFIDVLYYMIKTQHATPSSKWLGYRYGLDHEQSQAWWICTTEPGLVTMEDIQCVFYEYHSRKRTWQREGDNSSEDLEVEPLSWQQILTDAAAMRDRTPAEIIGHMVRDAELLEGEAPITDAPVPAEEVQWVVDDVVEGEGDEDETIEEPVGAEWITWML